MSNNYLNSFVKITSIVAMLGLSAQANAFLPQSIIGVDYASSHYDIAHTINSDDDIEKDFSVMSKNFDTIRTYSYDKFDTERILRAAVRYNMNVYLGIGIDYGDYKNNGDKYAQEQIAGIQKLFVQFPELVPVVKAIIVGNEFVVKDGADNGLNSAKYMEKIYHQVASSGWFAPYSTQITLVTSERDGVWEGAQGTAGYYLLSHLPQTMPILVNIYPYWANCKGPDSVNPTGPCDSFDKKWTRFASMVRNRRVIVGETGWPTGGGPGQNPDQPTQPGSLSDAILYYNYVYPYLKNLGVSMFAFSAFDEPIKGGVVPVYNQTFDHFWGVYASNGDLKPGMPYPLQKTVTPLPKEGTDVNIAVGPHSKDLLVTLTTDGLTYSTQPTTGQYQLTAGYPFLNYVAEGGPDKDVVISLPAMVIDGHNYPEGTCTNRLVSGNGIGLDSTLNLVWENKNSSTPPCSLINWDRNGVWLP